MGTITLTGAENLQITLSAEDMAKSVAPKEYYATTSSSGNHTDSAKNYDLATLTLSNSEATTKYTCTGNVVVTLEPQTVGLEEATLPTFKTGDAILTLKGPKNLAESEATTVDIDLSTITDGAESKKTKTISDVEFNLDGTETTTTKLTGDLKVINKADSQPNDGNQSYLANKAFKVTVAVESLTCSIDEATD